MKAVNILCIETANTVSSVAISKDGVLIAFNEVLEQNKAADKLHILVSELLDAHQLQFSDLSAIAISSGPGSYTGLRIATAAAKGYAYALNIPLIAIPTFQSMVYGVQHRYHQRNFDVYVPMIDARRMEAFTSFYNREGEMIKQYISIILDDNFNTMFDPQQKYLLFGNGSHKTKPLIQSDSIVVFDEFLPSAADQCLQAFVRYKNKNFEDIAYFEPYYSKEFHQNISSSR